MIEIKTEIEEIKPNTAADCKWIWVHKDPICILCLALMALWLLKYAYQAGNIWIAHYDVEIYVEMHHSVLLISKYTSILYSILLILHYKISKRHRNPTQGIIVWMFVRAEKKNKKTSHPSLVALSICLTVLETVKYVMQIYEITGVWRAPAQ